MSLFAEVVAQSSMERSNAEKSRPLYEKFEFICEQAEIRGAERGDDAAEPRCERLNLGAFS